MTLQDSSQGPGLENMLLAGPFDITAPNLHPDRAPLSKHLEWIRSYDWATTPLGAMETWSTELRRMVNVCLLDPKPAALWWGPEQVCIYNAPYTPILMRRHPAALGQRVFEVWPELQYKAFGLSFDLAIRTGEASSGHRTASYVDRADYVEELWASWDMLPIPGPDGILGMYNSVIEVTQEVLYERRMTLLEELDQDMTALKTSADFWPAVLAVLDSNPYEAPFAALYGPRNPDRPQLQTYDSVETDDSTSSSVSELNPGFGEPEWTLRGITTKDTLSSVDSTGLPATITLSNGDSVIAPSFKACMTSKSMILLRASDGSLPPGLQDAMQSRIFDAQPVTHAIFMPILTSFRENPLGFLLLGLNARRSYDASYQRFVRLLHSQLTTGLSTVMMAEDETRRRRIAARVAARDRIRLVAQLNESRSEVEQSEARFRSMADLAPIGIFEVDANGKLQYANDRWISIAKCSWDTLNNFETFTDALVKDDRKHAWNEWAKLRAGEQVRFECRLNTPFVTDHIHNGESVVGETWILVTAYALCEDTPGAGEIRGVFGCVVDISRQKWMEDFQERQVRQYENFMDSTNHEARNPLAAITLCAEDIYSNVENLIQQSKDSQLLVERKKVSNVLGNAGTIVACAKHQKRIIDDVLTLSKLDSGMFTLFAEPVRPVTVVDQALKMFQQETQLDDVELLFHIAESFQICQVDWVLLDPTRFLQILVNLLNNAFKFTKEEASRRITVTLDASTSHPTEADFGVRFAPHSEQQNVAMDVTGTDNVYLSIAIKDTGLGMSDEELDHLFQKFQQASHKTYAKYGGSGLGLWICKELCFRLGGKIGVASTLMSPTRSDFDAQESGSTFVFYVSAQRCDPPTLKERQHKQSIRNALEPVPDGVATDIPSSVESAKSTSNIHRIPNSEQSDEPSALPKIVTNDLDETITLTDTHILIVEDNLVNQNVVRRQLARAGFRVSVANHGREALDFMYPPEAGQEPQSSNSSACPEEHVDVVLMDFEMPVMGGLECTRLIRQREQEFTATHGTRHRRRPIVGVTANARPEQQSAALEAGMSLVITKPFQMAQLLKAINEVRTKGT